MIEFLMYFKDENGRRISIENSVARFKHLSIDEFYFFDGGFVLLNDGDILYEASELYDHFVGIHFLLSLWYYCNNLEKSTLENPEAYWLIRPSNDLDAPNGICQLRETDGSYLSVEKAGELVTFRYSKGDVLISIDPNSLIEPIKSVIDPYMKLLRKIFARRKKFPSSNLGRFCFLWEGLEEINHGFNYHTLKK
jgi:hypothetical protein